MPTLKTFAVGASCVLVMSFAGHAQTIPRGNSWEPVLWSSQVHAAVLFPAQILATANRHVGIAQPRRFGDPNGALGVMIMSPGPGTRVRVSIRVDGLAPESSMDATLPTGGEEYEIWPLVRFDAKTLSQTREPFPTTAVFSVSINGSKPTEQTRSLQVRSVNDVPFAAVTPNGPGLDLSYLFAAFVDENNPSIDALLHDALRVKAVAQFKGYQGSSDDVVREVFAVWNVLQRKGVKYSDITQPSGQSDIIRSQHVRFFDESLRNDQANCVDGSVLFASVLYRLGIYPVLVRTPHHMFLEFFKDRSKTHPAFLETTLIGNPGLNSMEKSHLFLTANGALQSASHVDFVRAMNKGESEFSEAAANLIARAPGYLLIDVDAARRAGIAAIGRF